MTSPDLGEASQWAKSLYCEMMQLSEVPNFRSKFGKLFDRRTLGQGSDGTWLDDLASVTALKVNWDDERTTLDAFDPEEPFLQPMTFDESHEFHDYVMSRCNQESFPHGYLYLRDWVVFFARLRPSLIGLRVLKWILSSSGSATPFYEVRGRLPRFHSLVHSYVLPTQIEACLQACLLEANVQMFVDSGGKNSSTVTWAVRRDVVRSERILAHYKGYIDDSDFRDYTFDMQTLIFEYLKNILPWPKKRNAALRNVIPFMVKYCAFFSGEFDCIASETSASGGQHDVSTFGRREKHNNPNIKLIESTVIRETYIDMLELVDERSRNLRDFLRICPFVEFDPTNQSQSRFLSLLLSLPILGGYGRANKISCMVGTKKIKDDMEEIGSRFEMRLRQLHEEAISHGYVPVSENEAPRASLGFMKSTSAAEKVRVNVDDGVLTFTTKAAVGLMKGLDIFLHDTERTFSSTEDALNVGTRDVPVKKTRIIYPIPLTVICSQMIVAGHLQDYAVTNFGTRRAGEGEMAAQISSGSSEGDGSRLIDDIDIVRISGDVSQFVFGRDFANFDTSLRWENFRFPMIQALKKIHSSDSTPIFGRARSEWVELAYGEGRVHNTRWNAGRRVVRAKGSTGGVLRGKEFMSFAKGLKKLAPPPGVKRVDGDLDDYKDKNGDILICSCDGSDQYVLNSHGSGELTTLLMNSVHNISTYDCVQNDPDFMSLKLIPGMVRVVGDDAFETYTVGGGGDWTHEKHDKMLKIVTNTCERVGLELNPSKCIAGFGFAEYRQTHGLRGVYIPKDQIMVISSEKSKNLDAPFRTIPSIRSMFMTKVSRGFSLRLAELMFWWITWNLISLKFKRWSNVDGKWIKNELNDNVSNGKNTEEKMGKKSGGKKQVFVHFDECVMLPISMNGCGVSPESLLVSTTEFDMGVYIGVKGNERLSDVMINRKDIPWYTVEPKSEVTQTAVKSVSGEYISKLEYGSTRKLCNAVGTRPLCSIPSKLLSRALNMEKRMLVRDMAGAEGQLVRMLMRKGGRKELSTEDMTNNMFVHGYEIQVVEDIVTRSAGVVRDTNLDLPLLFLRTHYGYGDKNKVSDVIGKLTRTIAKDKLMRNIMTANSVLEIAGGSGISPTDSPTLLRNYLMLHGFEVGIAERIVRVLAGSALTMSGLMAIDDGGVMSDEMMMSLGCLSEERLSRYVVNQTSRIEEARAIKTTIALRELRWVLRTGRGFKSATASLIRSPGGVNSALYISRMKNEKRWIKRKSEGMAVSALKRSLDSLTLLAGT